MIVNKKTKQMSITKSNLIFIFLISISIGFYSYTSYTIPQLIPSDYDCDKHPGFTSESTSFLFESGQHYVNRKGNAVKKQIEEVCG